MGSLGYWLVVAAALFSTVSALQANLLSASGLVHRMGEDRTFLRPFAMTHQRLRTPVAAISLNLLILILLLGFVRTVEVAGSAASLIFLIIYSCSHVLCLNSRKRNISTIEDYFKVPLYPWLPITGAVVCMALALFQGLVSPLAGFLVLTWSLVGFAIYKFCFSDRAEAVDAFLQAFKPELISYRGQKPVVLVPVTNPETAPRLTRIAHALATRESGRVLLLRVVNSGKRVSKEGLEGELEKAGQVVNQALHASLNEGGPAASALITVAKNPWREIRRVARQHNCRSLVLGVNKFDAHSLEPLLHVIEGDVALLSSPPNWRMRNITRVLVPIAGKTFHDSLRARVLGTILRVAKVEEVRFISIIPPSSSKLTEIRLRNNLDHHINDEAPNIGSVEILRSTNPKGEIVEMSKHFDLLVLGLSMNNKGEMEFGPLAQAIAKKATTACLLLGHARAHRNHFGLWGDPKN